MDRDKQVITQLEAEYVNAQRNTEVTNAALDNQQQYADFGGAFHLLKFGKKGEVSPIRLCNFTGEIEGEIVKSDGISNARYFRVKGRLSSGEPLPNIEVPAADFDRLDWLITLWGSKAQIVVGSRYKDHIVAAMKERSAPVQEQICQHTGWTQFNDQLVYLTASGGIGAEGMYLDARCELHGSLADFYLPAPAQLCVSELEQLLQSFLDVHKDGLAILLLGGVMRAPLSHFLPATFSIFLQGTTGVFKSAFAAVLQGFWGKSFDGTNLPANWSSTGNALEKIAFHAKDALLVTDDFIARGTRQEVAKTHSNAERLLRSQGNQSGRSRLSHKAELRPSFYPRGIVLATGEDLPNGASLQARLVYINFAKGSIDTSVLSRLQGDVRIGKLASIMASYIQWLAVEAKTDILIETLHECLNCDRENIGSAGHARTQDNVANLLTGLRIFLTFCNEVVGVRTETTEHFMVKATEAAKVLVSNQATLDSEASDASRFLELIRTAVTSGKAHLESCTGGQPDHSRVLGWREVETNTIPRAEAMGQRIGWSDRDYLYLDPNSSLGIVKHLSTSLDNHLGSSERTISKSLRESNLLMRCDKGRNTAKVRILGARRNVYVLNMTDVFEIDEQTDLPLGYNASDIPF